MRQLDLFDLRSAHTFVDGWNGPLRVLINNAGIMAVPELGRTPQGFELQFGTSYLGHFGLALGLHRFFAAAKGARVVSVISSGHFFSPVMFNDLGFDFVPYASIRAFGQSKLATALLSVGITQRWANDEILSDALNPGAFATGLQKHTGGLKTPVERRKTPEQGAVERTPFRPDTRRNLEGLGGSLEAVMDHRLGNNQAAGHGCPQALLV